ncbi:MAG: apolipoprotein N-acyltransferase [Spirochaetaceae bacterium]|jgi:apolipoprotein N-acyltransferase|nr:apolipoprotein N-acyltransferase [Spirochaetaceae bacterium]
MKSTKPNIDAAQAGTGGDTAVSPQSCKAHSFFQRLPVNTALLLFSAVLYAGAFPNPFLKEGFPVAAWIAYIGVFWVINRSQLGFTPLFGAFFGALSITLHNYWLNSFHPLAGIFTGILFAFYFALLFPALKCASLLLPRTACIVHCALWVGFEYLRTCGFTGYSYGITAYSQWTVLPLIKISALGGIWLVSALVIFPQVFIAQLISGKFTKDYRIRIAPPPLPAIFAWALLLFAAVGYGYASQNGDRDAQTRRITLVQPNSDPWKTTIAEFRKELAVLEQLSNMALSEEPPPELIIWPETAFVPSFYYHGRYRINAESANLVREAEAFLASKTVPFVVGNSEGRRVRKTDGIEQVVEYNAALVYDEGRFTGRYYKMKLVPFTEYFPYKKQFPALHKLLLNMDTHFWEPGTEPVILNAAGMRFATPICFEDTFGSVTREFTLRGAELLVNLSNDSWSQSLTAQYQHLSIAVFRAVETGRAMVRSTASGQTCAISPYGEILAMAEPMVETTLTVEVPLQNHSTLYTRIGDIIPVIMLVFTALSLCAGGIMRLKAQFGKQSGA